MIYTSFTNLVKTRDYRLFCIMMDIPYGSGTKYRTPAENRTVNQFLLTVNTGRRAVYLNFNRDLAVIVEPRSYSSFSGPSKALKQLFNDSYHTNGAKNEQ